MGGLGGSGGIDPNDKTPPSLGVTSDPESDVSGYVVRGTANDDVEIRELSYRANGADPVPLIVVDGQYGGFVELVEGSNTVVVTARDTGGNETSETITVTYTANPDEPEEPDFNSPNSIAAIDRALADGDIDEETALLYRLYAAFGDERLPPELRVGGYIDPGPLLRQTRARFDSLSPATRQAAAPFFVPPIYEGSWYQDAGAPKSLAAVPKGAPLDCEATVDPFWDFVETGKVRVWWNTLRPDHADIAFGVLNELETQAWPKLAGLTGKTPPYDSDEMEIVNDGCSEHYDVYVSHIKPNANGELPQLAYVTDHDGASGCKPWPSYMVVAGNKSVDPKRRVYLIAHEFMHSIQFAYRSCLTEDHVRWLAESTANWAINFVHENAIDPKYAPSHFEHAYAQQTYLTAPDEPIYLVDGRHEYGVSLLHYYLTQSFGDSLVPDLWDAVAEAGDLQTVLEEMNGLIPGGFEEEFPEFMLRLWNDDAVWTAKPGDNFEAWDNMTVSPANAKPTKGLTEVSAQLDGSPNRNILMTLGVKHLAAEMVHVKFDDPNVHSAMFSNGFTYEMRNGAPPELPTPNASDYAKEMSDQEKKGRHVWALVKQDGQWLDKAYDLTDVAFVPICQDEAEEAVEELVLIFTHADWEDEQIASAKGLAPRLFVSNMGCGPWVGDGRFDILVNEPDHVETTFVEFSELEFRRPAVPIEAALEGHAQLDFQGNIIALPNLAGVAFGASYELSSAMAQWSVNRRKIRSMETCLAVGNGSFDENDLLGPAVFLVAPYLSDSLGAGSIYRSFQIQFGIGSATPVLTDSCTGPEPFSTFLAGGLRDSPVGDFRVSSDGQRIDATWSSDEASFEIHLESSTSF